MPNLNAEINIDALYSMFKGEAGLRKSSVALSYPTPQYWFSWDKKMRSLLLPMQALKLDPKLVDYDDYTDWDKPRAKLEQLQLNCPYKTIIIDSITSAADAILAQGKKLKSGSDSKTGKKINNIQVNSIEDYNAEDAALSELVALTKDIHSYHKVNIILIAHVMEVSYKSPTQETVVSRTIVTAGKRVSIKIPAYCEEVYHFNIEKAIDATLGGDYTLLTKHTGEDFARTSLPLPKVIKFGDEPLYSKWIYPAILKLRGELTKQQTPTTIQTPNNFEVSK
jgi:hypothetical protein